MSTAYLAQDGDVCQPSPYCAALPRPFPSLRATCARLLPELFAPGRAWSRDPLPLLDALHRRANTAAVIAVRTDAGTFPHLGGLRTAADPARLPIAGRLHEGQAFVTLNGFAITDDRPNRYGLAHASRRRDSAAALNAAWIDLDDLSAFAVDGRTDYAAALLSVDAAIDAGLLPPPSAILQSGAGLWLLYRLADPDGQPPHTTPANVATWTAVQSALCDRGAAWGADRHAADLARIFRLPGTTNPKNPAHRVCYELQHDDRGQLRTYTLAELADWLKVDADAAILPPTTPSDAPADVPPQAGGYVLINGERFPYGATWTDSPEKRTKQHGLRRRLQSRLDYLTGIAALRGGIAAGGRNAFLFDCERLRSRLDSPGLTLDALNATCCRPPLGASEVGEVGASVLANLRTREGTKPPSDASLIGRHGITDAERAAVGWTIKARKPRRPRGEKARQDMKTWGVILAMLDSEGGVIPSSRKLSARLKQDHGIVVSPRTLQRWFRQGGPAASSVLSGPVQGQS